MVLDLGKNWKGNLSLVLTLPDGKIVKAPPYSLPPDGIYVPGEVTLAPGGSYHQALLLNEMLNFAMPGLYRLSLGVEQNPCSRVLSASLAIEIVPRDALRMVEICSRLATAAASYNSSVSTEAAKALSYARDEACLPAMIDVLTRSIHGKAWALTGLAQLKSDDAVGAVAAEWERLNEIDQAIAMREFAASGQGDALRAAIARKKRVSRNPRPAQRQEIFERADKAITE